MDRLLNRLQNFHFFYIGILILSKIVRYTVMYDRLVAEGIGWSFVEAINMDVHSIALNIQSMDSVTRIGSVANNNTVAFSELINLFGFTTYYEWEIFLTIVFNIILYKCIVGFFKSHPNLSNLEYYFILLNVAILNIYCFNMAKEFFQMIFWFITMYALKDCVVKRRGFVRVAIALGITVLFTRKYYGLVFIYFMVVDFFIDRVFNNVNDTDVCGKIKNIFGVISLFVIMSAIYYFMSSYLMMEAEETYEELERVNSTDRGGGASSTIMPIFGGGSAEILTLEYFIKIFRLMFPIELLMNFKATYVITIIFQGMLFYILINNLIHRKQCSVEKMLATDLYIAFWLTSAAFEPDFGSWMRHQSVVLPVMLYMLGSNSVTMVIQGNQRLYLKSC